MNQGGKGPKSGCFNCGGPHYASNCPTGKGKAGKGGKASELQDQQQGGNPWGQQGQQGAYHPMPQPLPNGPPGVHPALAQCNTSMPKQGDPWLCTLEAGEESQDSILPKATHTFKNKINTCLLYTSPSPRDQRGSRMPSSA